ncbi:MAG: hypothetical protein Kow0037_15980 [Calditrichia bacterium]
MMLKKGLAILLVLIFVAMGFSQISKDEAKKNVPMLLKALNYNKTLKTKMKDNCVIGLLYTPDNSASVKEKDILKDVIEGNSGIKIDGKKVKVVPIPISASANLEKKVIIHKINAFWLTTGTEAFANPIRESAKFNQVTTMATDEQMAQSGLAVLATRNTGAGYKLVVNVDEAKGNNIEISADLLKMATRVP